VEDASFLRIPLDQIEPDPNQPRAVFRDTPEESPLDNEAKTKKDVLAEAEVVSTIITDDKNLIDVSSLAHSIAAQGVLQPIMVEKIGDARYRIVAGERRWWASRAVLDWVTGKEPIPEGVSFMKGYDFFSIPAMVTRVTDVFVRRQVQLVENIQRLGMSPREIGAVIQNLNTSVRNGGAGLTIRDIAEKLGKNTNWVQNMMTAASVDGIDLGVRLRTKDWQYVRRLIAQKQERPLVYKRIIDRVEAGELFSRDLFEEEFKRHKGENTAERDTRRYEEQKRLDEERKRKYEQMVAHARSNIEPRAIAASMAFLAEPSFDDQEPDYGPPVSAPMITLPMNQRADPGRLEVDILPPRDTRPVAPPRLPHESDMAYLIRTRAAVYSEEVEGVDDRRDGTRVLVPHRVTDYDFEACPPLVPERQSEEIVNIYIRVTRSQADKMAYTVAMLNHPDRKVAEADYVNRHGSVLGDDIVAVLSSDRVMKTLSSLGARNDPDVPQFESYQKVKPLESASVAPVPNLDASKPEPVRPIPRPIPRPTTPRPTKPEPALQIPSPTTPRPTNPEPARPIPRPIPRQTTPKPTKPEPTLQIPSPTTSRPTNPEPARPIPRPIPRQTTPRPTNPEPVRPIAGPTTPRPTNPEPVRPIPRPIPRQTTPRPTKP